MGFPISRGAESFKPSIDATGFDDHGAVGANGVYTQKVFGGSQGSATRRRLGGGSFT